MCDGDISSFIGYYVSLTCDNNSVYEGEVGHVDLNRQLITLTHAHQMYADGTSLKFPRITLTGNHIKNLKIIRERIKLSGDPSEMTIGGGRKSKSPKQAKNISPKNNNNRSPPTQNKPTFDSIEPELYPDFDFEKNLALFDKHAVYEQMLQNTEKSMPNGIPKYDRKMKAQENILESEPVSLRQIKVPLKHAGKEYSTEDGFIVPAITLSLKKMLYAEAEKNGLSLQQIAENAGICICQMALQLVGGSLRINPNNNHQRPVFVVLAGTHVQGLQAICSARHLVNHTAKVILYLPEKNPSLKSQLDLFVKAGGKVIQQYRDLPTQPVDMVIDAMIGLEENANPDDWLPYAVSWANQNKAPILAIDPCLAQVSVEPTDIKWTIAMALPMIKSPKMGRLYLADIGIPRGVYADIDVQYMSPFKDKFYIPLHEC